MSIVAINPTTCEPLASYQEMTADDVRGIVKHVRDAFSNWRRTGFAERRGRMHAAAALLRDNAKEYARLMAQEMGKPVRDGVPEVQKCALACDYFAQNGEPFLAPEPIGTKAGKSYVAFRPLGVVLAIMPWKFPFWQVFRFTAPGLMAGNAAVLEHASNVPGCALAIEQVFRKAGFPDNLFRTFIGEFFHLRAGR
jgi:succinate-semialdehyde dehydrogenase / glutarate-semialdehyde dehydrogenase